MGLEFNISITLSHSDGNTQIQKKARTTEISAKSLRLSLNLPCTSISPTTRRRWRRNSPAIGKRLTSKKTKAKIHSTALTANSKKKGFMKTWATSKLSYHKKSV